MGPGVLDQLVTHPLVRLVEDLEVAIARSMDAPAWTLTPNELSALLPRLSRARNALSGVELRVLREADRHQVGDQVGAASTAGWWANTSRTTKRDAHRQVALAARLDEDSHAATAQALGGGSISVDQAAVILDAIEALPGELVPPALRGEAEDHLVRLAEHHDPRELRLLGRKILEVVAPQVAEEHEREVLEREEQDAAATASFTMHSDGHGSMVGRFKIPALAGEILRKHLDAIAAPRHRAAEGPLGEKVARPLALGRAFVEYLETRGSQGMPKAGGVPAVVVVTMTWESLLGADAAATLDSGESLSASEARRLACEAGIIPAVLGSRAQVLDLGRKTRFHTESQRIAIMLRDRGCVLEGCDWPPSRCHVHHRDPWAAGGGTSVKDGVLLCPRHHTLAHDARFQLKSSKNGRILLARRC